MSTTRTSPPPPATMAIKPVRGDIHHLYGTFLGGSPLNDKYELTSKQLFKFSTQCRSIKSLRSIERSLFDACNNTSCIKFNRNLEISDPSSNELDKEHFLCTIEELVCEHGQENFYYLHDSTKTMKCLWDNVHSFSVDDVILKFQACSADESMMENKSFDANELDDIGLSRLVVESRLTKTFMERIRTRFRYHSEFKSFLGSILVMMALDTCNASAAQDIAGASRALKLLDLSTYPGENVTNCAKEAQRLIKILQGDYVLPRQLGSAILEKFSKTSSEYFNRKVFSLLDQAKIMGRKYKLTNPRFIQADPLYSTLGPLAIVATLQQEHSTMLEDLGWPALDLKLPSGNAAPALHDVDTITTDRGKNSDGRICYICNSEWHLANTCSKRRPRKQRKKHRRNEGTTATSNNNDSRA